MFSKTHLPGSIKPQFLLCVLTCFLDATYECRPSGKFPGGPVVRGASLVWLNSKESACGTRDTGDTDSVPGLGRSPEGGHGNMLQYSCLENPKERGAWPATVHGVARSQTQLSNFTSLQLVLTEQLHFNLFQGSSMLQQMAGFPSFRAKYSIIHTHPPYPPLSGCSGCFCILATVSSAAVKRGCRYLSELVF